MVRFCGGDGGVSGLGVKWKKEKEYLLISLQADKKNTSQTFGYLRVMDRKKFSL